MSFHTIDIEIFCRMKDYEAVLCIVHCNKVSKPVKGKYLLLCMNSIMYLLLTLIMLLKVLSHLMLKIKSFM